jgi:hypothetical protein
MASLDLVEAFDRTSSEESADGSERQRVELIICSRVDKRNMVNNNMSTDMNFIASAVEPGGA